MMMTMKPGILQIAGHDAKTLLQGQLTCDMNEVLPGKILFGAHCNPHGRVISFFRIFLWNDTYCLQMPYEMIPVALLALKKYAVFFKVTLTDATDIFSDINDDKIADIKKGIPAIYPETSEQFLPHDLNLHQLGAMSFTKGCYTGQEIIARMQYRGKLKNHLYQAHSENTTAPIRGNPIYTENKEAGTMVDYVRLEKETGYQLLVIASEKDIDKNPLFLDVEKKIKLNVII